MLRLIASCGQLQAKSRTKTLLLFLKFCQLAVFCVEQRAVFKLARVQVCLVLQRLQAL